MRHVRRPGPPDALIRGAVLSAAALLWVLVLSRVVGLRSFSKMTAVDFVATIASGSLLANAAVSTDWPAFVQPMVALLAVFVVQVVLAWLRQRSDGFRSAVDNRPHVLMWDGVIDEAALRRTRIARADVLAKLRDADAGRLGEVRAVVLEATGDISVLCSEELDRELTEDLENRPDRALE
jgi:uncharacterized membrane protein YcaP (DUF421 family)